MNETGVDKQKETYLLPEYEARLVYPGENMLVSVSSVRTRKTGIPMLAGRECKIA
jgi:hypothetical protein